MSKIRRKARGGGLGEWLADPKNREKMYASDREDAKELLKWREEENNKELKNKDKSSKK